MYPFQGPYVNITISKVILEILMFSIAANHNISNINPVGETHFETETGVPAGRHDGQSSLTSNQSVKQLAGGLDGETG